KKRRRVENKNTKKGGKSEKSPAFPALSCTYPAARPRTTSTCGAHRGVIVGRGPRPRRSSRAKGLLKGSQAERLKNAPEGNRSLRFRGAVSCLSTQIANHISRGRPLVLCTSRRTLPVRSSCPSARPTTSAGRWLLNS